MSHRAYRKLAGSSIALLLCGALFLFGGCESEVENTVLVSEQPVAAEQSKQTLQKPVTPTTSSKAVNETGVVEKKLPKALTPLSLHGLFSDNMILQRGQPVVVRGWCEPDAPVTVSIKGVSATTKAGADGAWTVTLPKMNAGGPHVLTVEAAGVYQKQKASLAAITLSNVMVGDIWICSGQSNMDFVLKSSDNAAEEIKDADNYPNIRLYKVSRRVSHTMPEGVAGTWKVCSAATVPGFSAVGYFYGRELYTSLEVPVGLIHTAWGGTPAEAWTTNASLLANDVTKPIITRYQKALDKGRKAKTEAEVKELAEWKKHKFKNSSRHVDPGNTGEAKGWARTDFADADWKEMKLPNLWDEVMHIDGVIWFRKEITIPVAWKGQPLVLTLGSIDDFDITYFNGTQVGKTGSETENWWTAPRSYEVPAELVADGKAVIAVRVFDHYGAGGFGGTPGQMTLGPKEASNTMSLAGAWRYAVAHKMISITRPRAEVGPNHQYSPAGLYEGMIHCLTKFPVAGAIWYQGESNAGRAEQYRTLLPMMITDWRKAWGQDFPFFIVQLANFTKASDTPVASNWAELREAQTMTAEQLPKTGLAVAIDIGDAKDIHPRNKQDVGRRLALAARSIAFGETLVYSGPWYKSMKIEGASIRLVFDHVGGGLVAKEGPLKRFAIAGADEKFVWADAVIDGETVVVKSDAVKAPVAVRYAWSNNPDGCNLYNKEGLPAVPFRTDEWTITTAGRR